MLNITNLNTVLKSSSDLLALIGHESPEDSGQSLVSAYNKTKSRLSSSEVASKFNLSESELPLFEASLRDFAKRFDAIEGDDPERTTVISALRLVSWLETLQSRGVAITVPDFSGLPVDEDVGRKQIRALELILRSLVSERFGGDLEQRLKTIIKPELVDKWKASGDLDDLLSGTTFSELASLVVNKDEFSHYEKLYAHSAYLNYLRNRRKTVQNFLDDIRRVRNVLAHNKSVSDAQLQLLELYYEELTSPIQDAFDNGETSVDPSAYLDVSREELQSYFVDLKEDIASVQGELADFRASVEGDLGVIKEDTSVIRETTVGIMSRTTMIVAGVIALLILVGGSYFFLTGTQENTEAILGDTATIKQTTTATNQAITEVQQSSRRIEGSLDSIQQGFETLSQSGGVMQNPEQPEQFYHNARVYEDRGDYLNARKSYNEFFKFQLEVLDPYLRYSTFVKVQEGRKGAIEVFSSLLGQFPTKSGELAKILLEENPSRTEQLKSFAENNQTYMPAYYYLAEQYSRNLVGNQSLEYIGNERKALNSIVQEELANFFINKALVSDFIRDINSRLNVSASISSEILTSPVTLENFAFTSDGWVLVFGIREIAKSISFSEDLNGTYQDNGYGGFYPNGQRRPNSVIRLPSDAPKRSLFVKYQNINDEVVGPYEIVFDPVSLRFNEHMRSIKLVTTEWMWFNRRKSTLPPQEAKIAQDFGYVPQLTPGAERYLKVYLTSEVQKAVGALWTSITKDLGVTEEEEYMIQSEKLAARQAAIEKAIGMSFADFGTKVFEDPYAVSRALVAWDSSKYQYLNEIVEAKKNELERRTSYDVTRVDLSRLFTANCAVAEVKLKSGDKSFVSNIVLPQCNPSKQIDYSDYKDSYLPMIPPQIRSVSAKLKFRDGSFSDERIFSIDDDS
jgi:tetratricopeptide (TPR) repeat protein